MNKVISSLGLVCFLFGVANAEIISKNGIATDTVTGLMWLDNDETTKKIYSYQEGVAYCSSLQFNGYDDWRLPNIYELATLLDNFKRNDPYNVDGFQKLNNAGVYRSSSYYSSNPNYNGRTGYSWTLNIYAGSLVGLFVKDDEKDNIRCVRGKQLGTQEIDFLYKSKKLKISKNELDKLPISESTVGAEKNIDEMAYNIASSQNTIPAYKAYLKEFPNGEYASSARSNIQYLESEAQFRALLQSKSPQTMYIEAGKQERNGNTSKANKLYEAIIDRFPNSDFAVKASDKLTSANRAERAESNRRSQSRQECENNENACLAGCGTYISGADSHNNAVWSCNDKCKQISCY